jgi:hypothetical protein
LNFLDMTGNKTLVAGPWVGEFGWELFAWQAYVRSLSKHYDQTVIVCRESSEPLYTDFASSVIHYDPPGGPSDQWFRRGCELQKCLQDLFIAHREVFVAPGTSVLLPRRIGIPNDGVTSFQDSVPLANRSIVPEYVRYGADQSKEYDYIFHIRHRAIRQEDNWSMSKWHELLDWCTAKGHRVGCMGTITEALSLPGADDLRGLPLAELTTVLRNCRAVFGPSSGPMHLASVCGAPHVVWSRPQNELRYLEHWNPLSTPVLFLCAYGWHPEPKYVMENFENWDKQVKMAVRES